MDPSSRAGSEQSSPMPQLTPSSPAKTMEQFRTAPTPPQIAVLDPRPSTPSLSKTASPALPAATAPFPLVNALALDISASSHSLSNHRSPLTLDPEPAAIADVATTAGPSRMPSTPITPPSRRVKSIFPNTPAASHLSQRNPNPPRPAGKSRQRLSPLLVKPYRSGNRSRRSNDSMPEAPSPQDLDFDHLFPSGSPETTIKRAVVGLGNSPAKVAANLNAQMQEVLKLVNLDGVEASEEVRATSASPDESPRSQYQPSPTQSVRRSISPIQGFHLVTIDQEPNERYPWQTPPLKQIVEGHPFLDADESPRNHRLNFPELYDDDGNPLQPEVPWSGKGYDIGYAPFNPTDNFTLMKRPYDGYEGDDITAKQYRKIERMPSEERMAAYQAIKDGTFPDSDSDSPSQGSGDAAPPPDPDARKQPERRASAAARAATAGPSAMVGEAFGDDDAPTFEDPISSGSDTEYELPPQKSPSSRNVARVDSDDDADNPSDADEADTSGNAASSCRREKKKQGKKKVDKGKQRAEGERPSTTPSTRGRLTSSENEQLAALGLKIKADIEGVARSMGINYATALRKVGFGKQEVRSGHLPNIYRMVHRHRQHAAGLPPLSTVQHNQEYVVWKEKYGDDPTQVNKLLQEHQEIVQGELKPLKTHDIEKRVSEAATQFAQFSKNYLLGLNVAVVGAVIHLGPELASSFFGSSAEQNIALLKGFDVDSREWLLKAKSILMLHEDSMRKAAEGEEDTPKPVEEPVVKTDDAFWRTSSTARDDYARWLKAYLHDITVDLITPTPAKWDFKQWPSVALKNSLVLVGWGPDVPQLPNASWITRETGAIHLAQLKTLLGRVVPKTWRNIDKKKLIAYPEDEYGLTVMKLDDFLARHPEHRGRHPCVADHEGNVLWFADEEKAGFASKKPARSRAKSKVAFGSRRPPPPPTFISDESGDSDRGSTPDISDNPAFRVGGVFSPSGKVTKRAKVVPTRQSASPSPPELCVVRPLPHAGAVAARKRKRDSGEQPPVAPALPQEVLDAAPRPSNTAVGPAVVPRMSRPPDRHPQPHQGPPGTSGSGGLHPQFSNAYPPNAYTPMHPYMPQQAYPGPHYPGPFYGQPFPSPQPWMSHLPQQPGGSWPPLAATDHVTPEEMEQVRLLRAKQARGAQGPPY
ncbi:hypothetical protein HWV62_42896 [Athelia sp. TMB]|nr:hypothetical protein HWV62_42896 [Athelia sp. TMB]